jgi:glc operon protein GlcG
MPSNQIPYATEQGIFGRVAGKIFRGTGNLQLRIVGFQPPLQRIKFLEATEVRMKNLRPAMIPTIAITSLLLILALGYSGFAQTPASPPTLAPPLISLAEARVIIDGAVAFTRDQNLNMAVVVVDAAGNLVSADKMDGTTINNTRFAEGKAFASAILRQTTDVLANLAKERPDRYFGIMNMYPGKVYLVGGGVPLTVDGRLVGAVGVAGLPQGVDEKAARAGIAAWEKFREKMKK